MNPHQSFHDDKEVVLRRTKVDCYRHSSVAASYIAAAASFYRQTSFLSPAEPPNLGDFPSWCYASYSCYWQHYTTPHPPAAAAVAPFCCGTDSIDTHFSDAINIKIRDRRAIYFPLHNIQSYYKRYDFVFTQLYFLPPIFNPN